MPYIGTTPTKVVSRQSANVYRYEATAGQTAFTGADLDNNVLACNPADMIVHMNGLRLESTDYTATSTTVTLTTAATAGDEVTVTSFVTFEVADTYTKTAADSRYVNTTGDTMTGALALPTGGLTVGTDQLAVDSAGRVTMPYQPAFCAYVNATGNLQLTGSVISYDATVVNTGNHYNTSTYGFTAPIAGNYYFEFSVWTGEATTTRCAFYKNGTGVGHPTYPIGTRNEASSNQNDSGAIIINLAANDVIDVRVYAGAANTFGTNAFCGYLIG